MSGKVLDIIIKLSWFGRIVKFIDSIAIGSCEEVSKIGVVSRGLNAQY